jgi:hypothetical protein
MCSQAGSALSLHIKPDITSAKALHIEAPTARVNSAVTADELEGIKIMQIAAEKQGYNYDASISKLSGRDYKILKLALPSNPDRRALEANAIRQKHNFLAPRLEADSQFIRGLKDRLSREKDKEIRSRDAWP